MSTTLSRAGLSELLKSKSPDATCNWDVLVSYSETQLNQVLKKKWANLTQVTQVTFHTDPDEYLRIEYSVTLGSPSLQFSNDTGATLVMSIEGSAKHYVEKVLRKTVDITKNNYSLQVFVKLGSIEGEHDQDVKTSKDIIVFQDGKTSDRHIIFHFKNDAETNFKVLPKVTTAPDVDDMTNNTPGALQNWFKANMKEIDVALAQVCNKNDPTSQLLRPKAFRFRSQPGVLSLFIQTQGQKGDDDPKFDTKNNSPIPQGSTASIIISRRLFQEEYLIPEIKKGCKDLDGCIIHHTDQPGVTVDLNFSMDIVGGSVYHSPETFELEDVTVKCSDIKNPVKLEITNSSAYDAPQYNWNWKWEGKAGYNIIYQTVVHSHATVSAEIKGPKRTLTTVSGDTVHFSLVLNNDDQPQCEVKVPSVDITPKAYLGALDLKLADLNFFTTQNILVPGAELITISAVMVPSELVLMGDVVH